MAGLFTPIQGLRNLLFCHWPLPQDALRRLVPAPLAIHTFEGVGYLSLVALQQQGGHFGVLPHVPGLFDCCELNLRTYVTLGDEPAVWFISVDMNSRLTSFLARRVAHLPVFYAEAHIRREQDALSCAFHRDGGAGPPAHLVARYQPEGKVFTANPGTLDHFLVERRLFYSRSADGEIFQSRMAHPPWPLQRARATIEANTVAAVRGIQLPEGAPLLHYSAGVEAVGGPVVKAGSG